MDIAYRPEHEPYFGQNPLIEKVKGEINIAVAANCEVLLLGETGTGKGTLARWIHDRGSRRERAFVDVNCSGLKGELLKSELFGHVKGSFTGAIGDRPGYLEEANGGTLFMDEIGDTEIETQGLLLKAIEERAYRRIGENRQRLSDFRLICATNRDLSEAVSLGAFRPDLFYRVNMLSITLPPLRERKSDIVGLLNYFLSAKGYSRFPLSNDLINALTRYPWPGNIRELRNTLERALLLARREALTIEHFPNLNRPLCPLPSEPVKEAESLTEPEAILSLAAAEKRYIQCALEHLGGDKNKTSLALEISLSTLYRKLKKIQFT
ncbi:MAG: sigma-54 dependent transcriptional regulator [Chitinispirillales bacterium]|jgi:DNA-binding NtrC family response regulator|nr:sigma-54 dependent transcriptional regulator [Chitinispirillales bacterium]